MSVDGRLLAGIWLAALVWSVILCRQDWRERRLPNAWTLGGAAAALLVRLALGGLGPFLSGFAAAVVGGLFLLLPFLARGAGGGDVKMLFAAGAVAGWEQILPLLVYTAFAGLGVAVALLAAGRVDGARLKHYLRCACDFRYDRRAGRITLPDKESERVRVPFSLAIAIGLLAATWPL
ncbi:MAG: prepilin peptidase [Lentisphaeria bacterium]